MLNTTSTCPNCGNEVDMHDEFCSQCGQKNPNHHPFRNNFVMMRWYFHLGFFIMGLFGLNLLSYVFSFAFASYYYTDYYSGYVNFMVYGTVFIFLLAGVLANWDKFKPYMKDWTKYLLGLPMGFAVLMGTAALNMFLQNFQEITTNANETAIRGIVSVFPLLSLLILGIIGPICEELTYRVGLFSLIAKKNKILAYIATTLIFGLIHFDFGNITSINEWLNLPTYLLSGFLLTLTYDLFGLPGSIVAHATNNLIAVFLSIINGNG